MSLQYVARPDWIELSTVDSVPATASSGPCRIELATVDGNGNRHNNIAVTIHYPPFVRAMLPAPTIPLSAYHPPSQLPLLGSNQDSPDPESGVLPITPRGSDSVQATSGQGGIRTHEGLHPTRFPIVLLKPLGHLSRNGKRETGLEPATLSLGS